MSEDGVEAPTDGAGLIVLDGDPVERQRIEEMADELGVELWAATPEDLVPERSDTWESLAQAQAVVVATQFGPHAGLDIIESLAWRAESPTQVRALALDRANRAWVAAALQAGATTCVLRPFDVAELKTKVVEVATPGDETNGAAEDTESERDARDSSDNASEGVGEQEP